MKALFKVFVQNEAGSNLKHRHNEKTLTLQGSIALHESYPFPYGFVLATTTADGDNVDCIILTREPLHTGTIVDCHPIGLLEFFENGALDHKVLAVLPGESSKAIDKALISIHEFYQGISGQFPDIVFHIGECLPAESAVAYIEKHREKRDHNVNGA